MCFDIGTNGFLMLTCGHKESRLHVAYLKCTLSLLVAGWYLCVSCHRVIILDEDTNLMKSTLSVTFVFIRGAIIWKCFRFQLNLA